jgi:hypothetical protein
MKGPLRIGLQPISSVVMRRTVFVPGLLEVHPQDDESSQQHRQLVDTGASLVYVIVALVVSGLVRPKTETSLSAYFFFS